MSIRQHTLVCVLCVCVCCVCVCCVCQLCVYRNDKGPGCFCRRGCQACAWRQRSQARRACGTSILRACQPAGPGRRERERGARACVGPQVGCTRQMAPGRTLSASSARVNSS